MEIILKENVQGLGFKNEIVTVKDGYGRNFLIPTGKAIVATASAKKELAEVLKQQAHKLEKIKNDALALAAKINAVEGLKIATKVSATGAIYGSVTSLHIAEELVKLGLDVDRKSIVLDLLDIIAQSLLRALDTESGDDDTLELVVFTGELDLQLCLVTDRDLLLRVADRRHDEDGT